MKFPDGVKMTPMLQQYAKWKDEYPDCLLLFRMGDFYELFFDDAVTASNILDITLTARDQDKAIPMAGVPHHALEPYLGKLIAAGQRVAICDQMTEPDGRTLVERSVTRIVTPGTHLPESADGEGRLAAFAVSGDSAAVAFLSPGTGSLEAGTFRVDEAVAMTLAFEPREMLVPAGQRKIIEPLMPEIASSSFVERERGEFSPALGAAWLCKRWNIASLRAMGLDDSDGAVGAASAALRYLEETQFGGADHVSAIRHINPEGVLVLDQATRYNLELVEGDGVSLYSVINRCKTPMGRRLLRDWISHPLADIDAINERLDAVEFFVNDSSALRKLGEALAKTRDMERSLGRLALRVGNPRDLAAVRDMLQALPELRNAADGTPLAKRFAAVPDLSSLSAILNVSLADEPPRVVSDGGVVRAGYDAQLDEWRDAIAHAEENLRAFEEAERARTGIKIRVGVNKVFGYYIEVSKSYLDRVPDDYIRRQTVASGERYVTEELKNIEKKVLRAEHEIGKREAELYGQILERALTESAACQAAARAAAAADVIYSFAEIARDRRYCRPAIDASRAFDVIGARHPVVEHSLGTQPFTPNDICLDPDDGACLAIITGPNMAGKSTYLRTAALIALLAHVGSFVPAERARIGLVDRIFTRIGARDELARGRSTFMVEMVETANILRHVGPRSLVILDEIGRGTSTYDGMSIAWAVVEFLQSHIPGRTKALFATHYHELTALSEVLPQTINLSMDVEETNDGIRFLHRVVPRPADRSYGIEVARLAGIPQAIIRRSQELLARFEEKENVGSGIDPAIFEPRVESAQKQITFFDVERDGIIEELAASDPNQMTPMEALELLFKLQAKSRKVLDQQK